MELLSIYKLWYLKVKFCKHVIFEVPNHVISDEESKLYMAPPLSKQASNIQETRPAAVFLTYYRKQVCSVHALGLLTSKNLMSNKLKTYIAKDNRAI